MQILPIDSVRDDFTTRGFGKLSTSLERIKRGNETVLITPQAKRVGPDTIVNEWKKVFDSKLSEMNEDLLELEESNRLKIGPRSIAKPWSDIRQATIDGFNIDSVNCEHLITKPKFSSDIGKLRPLSLENSAKLTKSNTQAGAPTLLKKGVVRADTVSKWKELYEMNLPMIPAIRTQEQGKTRLVKIVDYATIMQENRYFVPLFNYQKSEFCYSAFNGPVAVDTAMTQLITDAVDMGYQCVSGDIEGFDDSVGPDLSNCAFDEVKQLFQSQYHSEIDEIAYLFSNKSLVTPEGVFEGPHGIPSGSNFTNIIGSMVNRQVSEHPMELSQYLGDDLALAVKEPEDIFTRYNKVGLKMNKTKTLVKPYSFVYLQMLHHIDYVTDGEFKGIYPTWRALNRLIYPERFSDFNDYDLTGSNYFAIRSLSIMENCKYHPLFEEFVKLWMRFEKYTVPENKSIAAFAKMTDEKLGSLGTTNQYGSKIKGLKSFESYRLAMKYA